MPLQFRILRIGHVVYNPFKAPKPHQNNFYHVCWVLNGRGYIRVNENLHEVGAGDLHVYRPGWTHDIWPRPGSHFETLDLRFVPLNPESLSMTASLPTLIRSAGEGTLDWIRRIEAEGRTRRDAFWQDMAHAHVVQLIVELCRLPSRNATPAATLAAQAAAQMRRALPRGIAVQPLADQLFVSASHLAVAFKAAFDKSPHEFMRDLKLDQAQRDLLLDENVRVREVAERFGWKDVRHFRRLFVKHSGLTPRAFAERHRHVSRSPACTESWLVFNDDVPMQWTHLRPNRR